MKKTYLTITFIITTLSAFSYTQTDLLNAQNSFQNISNQNDTNQSIYINAESDLTRAQNNLVTAQKKLQNSQESLQKAKQNYTQSQLAKTKAARTVDSIWNQVNPSTTK